jgi:hypothetical protein
MKNKMYRKCLITVIIMLFFWLYAYPNCTMYYPLNRTNNNGLGYLASATEFDQLSQDLQFRDIIWNVTLSFIESNSANDNVIFGEVPDANDGPPADSYDAPKPPAPPYPPYIRAGFDDNLPAPYNYLWKDYRHNPDTSKQWNLSIRWEPEDGETPTNITISWITDEVDDSEYNIVKLCNSSGVQLKNMLTESSYSFTCPAMVPQIFYIICQTNNTAPNRPEKPSGQTQGNINVEYTYSSRYIDIDGNQIYYWFDWGDGKNSGWIGPYASGAAVIAKHAWTLKGAYQLKVKAKDTSNAESDWSDPLTMTVDNTRPIVKIIKPVKGLYIKDKMIRPFFIRKSLIVGSITIEVLATDDETGIDRVEFYAGLFGNKLLGNATEAPYIFILKRDRIRLIHIHILKVVAYDKVGNYASDFIIVRKIV